VAALGQDVAKRKEREIAEAAAEERRKAEEEAIRVTEEAQAAAYEREQQRIQADNERHGVVEGGGTTAVNPDRVHHDPNEADGKSEAKRESDARAKELISEAVERGAEHGAGGNVEHFIHFEYQGEDRTLGVPEGANLFDVVTNFCRKVGGGADVGECTRELMMAFKLEHPELSNRRDL
jgi:hypothetical protein